MYLFFSLLRHGLSLLLSIERAIFATLWQVVRWLAILRSWVSTHLWTTALVLGTSLPYSFVRLWVLHDIVVRIIVRLFTVLWSHFKIVHQFILTHFAVWILHRLHWATNPADVLTPLSITNVTLWLLRRYWSFIKVGWRKPMSLVIVQWSLICRCSAMLTGVVRLALSLARSDMTWLQLCRIGWWCG